MGTGASAPPKKPTLPVPDDVLVIVLGFVSFSSCRDGESEPLLDVVTMRAVCKEWSRLIKRFPRDYLAICGRYYLTRFNTTGQAVACRRPGPASFADARGALVISASRSSSCNHGKLRIKGLADPGGEGEGRVTGRPYETTLVHDGPAQGTYMTRGFGYSIRVPPHQNYEQGVAVAASDINTQAAKTRLSPRRSAASSSFIRNRSRRKTREPRATRSSAFSNSTPTSTGAAGNGLRGLRSSAARVCHQTRPTGPATSSPSEQVKAYSSRSSAIRVKRRTAPDGCYLVEGGAVLP